MDNLIGLFSRGNSHVIRLAVPLHLLFKAFEDNENDKQDHNDDEKSNEEVCSAEDITNDETECSSELGSPADESHETHDTWTEIDRSAIEAAQSIVKTCLQHACK